MTYASRPGAQVAGRGAPATRRRAPTRPRSRSSSDGSRTAGVGEHLPAALRRPGRIDGHERAAGDHRGEHPDDHLGGARHRDADDLLVGAGPARAGDRASWKTRAPSSA